MSLYVLISERGTNCLFIWDFILRWGNGAQSVFNFRNPQICKIFLNILIEAYMVLINVLDKMISLRGLEVKYKRDFNWSNLVAVHKVKKVFFFECWNYSIKALGSNAGEATTSPSQSDSNVLWTNRNKILWLRDWNVSPLNFWWWCVRSAAGRAFHELRLISFNYF